MSDTTKSPFLIEVGTDELPARFLPVEREHVSRSLATLLSDTGLAHGDVRVLATPRRLAVLIDDLQDRQEDREIEVKGPPVAVCYDDDGAPTKAAEGFARKNGIDLAAAYEVTDEKGGRFLGARKVVEGRAAADLLAEALPGILLAIPFPKTMRWGTGEIEYARPVQWIVALLGDDVVPVELAGVKAGRTSRGHRTLADGCRVEIASPGAYLDELRKHGVVVDQDERRAMITDGAAAVLAENPGAVLREDDELLGEVVDLCEHPTPFLGSYDESFFELPDEVIVTALKAHQRYFAVGDADGGLRPHFLAARDGDANALDNVRHGNERVLRARLSDALFYWEFDQKKSPDEHTDSLAQVTWLVGYGSMKDKVDRVSALAPWLWANGLGDGGECPADLKRAATICRFDMVTEMIKDGKEFTKREGVIASRYAARAGESEGVCGILEQYHRPRSAGDGLPVDRASAVLSVADRCDTLAGCWLAGFAPTGAKDPYALRRHTLAIIRILLGLEARVDLRAVLEQALAAYAGLADESRRAEALDELMDFAATRLEGHLVGTGLAPEVVRATLPVHGRDPSDLAAWAGALEGFRTREEFLMLAKGVKRCRNILDDAVLSLDDLGACRARWAEGGHGPDGEDFRSLPEPAELELLEAVSAAAPKLAAAEEGGTYADVFAELSALGPLIDGFFDSVRVNVDDEALQALRKVFLGEIQGLFASYADVSAVAPVENLSSS